MAPVDPTFPAASRRRGGGATTPVLAVIALASVGLLGLAVWQIADGEVPSPTPRERVADPGAIAGSTPSSAPSAALAASIPGAPSPSRSELRQAEPARDHASSADSGDASRVERASPLPDRPGRAAGSASAGADSFAQPEPSWAPRGRAQPARPGTAAAALEALQSQKESAGLATDESGRASERDDPSAAGESLGYIEIQSVWAGTDAEAAGIRPGDRITRIGDVEIRGPSDMGRVMQLKGNVTVHGVDSTGKPWTIPDVPGPVCCMFFHKAK